MVAIQWAAAATDYSRRDIHDRAGRQEEARCARHGAINCRRCAARGGNASSTEMRNKQVGPEEKRQAAIPGQSLGAQSMIGREKFTRQAAMTRSKKINPINPKSLHH